jgi:hypothetical protein
MSFKNRITYLDYYWETLKMDMSKVLLADARNASPKAKVLSVAIFSISREKKH